jgi:hypothetical protein
MHCDPRGSLAVKQQQPLACGAPPSPQGQTGPCPVCACPAGAGSGGLVGRVSTCAASAESSGLVGHVSTCAASADSSGLVGRVSTCTASACNGVACEVRHSMLHVIYVQLH